MGIIRLTSNQTWNLAQTARQSKDPRCPGQDVPEEQDASSQQNPFVQPPDPEQARDQWKFRRRFQV